MSAATRAKTAKERATIAIRMMQTNISGDFSRAFDDCFEMGDGDAVVMEIARRAMHNPALLELVKQNRGVAWSSVVAALDTLGFKEPETKLSEDEETRRGELLAEVLGLRKKGDRYCTTWGDKTALGLFRTIERLILEGK